MHWLVYEHLTAAVAPAEATPSLLAEGRAMRQAIVAALAKVPGLQISVCQHPEQAFHFDPHLPIRMCMMPLSEADQRAELARLGATVDQVILIAPETGGVLLQLAEAVVAAGGQLFGPDVEAIRVYSDKRLTKAALSNFSAPDRLTESTDDLIIVRPCDGAGCLATIVGPASDRQALLYWYAKENPDSPPIVEPYWQGVAASVGCLISGDAVAILPPLYQRIEMEPVPNAPSIWRTLHYRGGYGPTTVDHDRRITWLARRFIAHLQRSSGSQGYFGLDVVLLATADGPTDFIVEVNPRFTTSVVAYQACFGAAFGHALVGYGEKLHAGAGFEWPRNLDFEFSSAGQMIFKPTNSFTP